MTLPVINRGLGRLERNLTYGSPSLKWSRRLYRYGLAREWKHRYEYGPLFQICDGNGLRKILWNESCYYQHGLQPPSRQSEELLILATGPSVLELDLKKFVHADIMTVNGAITLVHDHGLKPEFNLVLDPDFFIYRSNLVSMGLEQARCSIFSTLGLSILAKRQVPISAFNVFSVELLPKNWLYPQPQSWLSGDSAPEWLVVERHRTGSVAWSHRPDLGVSGGGTAVYAALQLAVWLGYEKINIGGMDLTGGAKRARFYEKEGEVRPSGIDRDYATKIEPSFRLYASLENQLGCRTFNLSPGSRLPASILPKV